MTEYLIIRKFCYGKHLLKKKNRKRCI